MRVAIYDLAVDSAVSSVIVEDVLLFAELSVLLSVGNNPSSSAFFFFFSSSDKPFVLVDCTFDADKELTELTISFSP